MHLTGIGIASLAVFGVGFLLAIVAIVLLFRRSLRAPLVAIVAVALFFPAAIADQTGHLSSLRPQIAIGWIELATAIVAILGVGFALWVLRKQAPRKP